MGSSSGLVASRRLALACARRGSLAPSQMAVTSVARAATTPGDQQRSMGLATKVARPVSPHVMIYAWPLAAISSVTVRITGGLLSVGVYGIGIGSLLGADMAGVMAALGSSGIGPLVKLGVAFPLSYHFLGAARHFYWEKKPEGLNPESQKQSSIAIFAATGVISLAAMAM